MAQEQRTVLYLTAGSAVYLWVSCQICSLKEKDNRSKIYVQTFFHDYSYIGNMAQMWIQACISYTTRLKIMGCLFCREQKIWKASKRGAGSLILGGPDRQKIFDSLERHINDPLSSKRYSLPFFPTIPATPVTRTLEGLFEPTQCPSKALGSPHALLSEIQRHNNSDKCCTSGP